MKGRQGEKEPRFVQRLYAVERLVAFKETLRELKKGGSYLIGIIMSLIFLVSFRLSGDKRRE